MFKRLIGALWRTWRSATSLLRDAVYLPDPSAISDANLHTLADTLPHLVWMSSPEGHSIYFNAPWRRYTGHTEPNMDAWAKVLHPADAPHVQAALDRAARDKAYFEYESRILGADNQYRWFLTRVVPMQDSQGKLLRFFATSTDIDAQKRTELQHRQSERRLQLLIDLTSSVVFTLDRAGAFLTGQRAWQRYSGQSQSECCGHGWMHAVHPDDRRRVEQEIVDSDKVVDSLDMDLRIWHADSATYRHCIIKATRLQNDALMLSDEVWVGMLSDVHEARERQAYQERLLAVMQSSSEFVALATAEGKMMYVNESGRRTLGLPRFDDGQNINLLELFCPEDRQFVQETVLPEAMIHGRWRGRFRFRHWHSKKTIPVHYNVFATLSEDESFLGFGSIARDITDDLAAQKALEAAIAARDDFLSIASHELKTPLTALKLQLQICARGLNVAENRAPTPARLQRVMDIANRQVDRLGALVEDLLDVSRIQAGKMMYRFDTVSVDELVLEVMQRLGDAYAEAKVELSTVVDSAATAVCDRFRIEQVLINLLTNALKYGETKPVLVRVGGDANEAWFSVQDQGMGIDKSNLEKIFKRFERALSHHNISGLGLGLYISKQIVDAHRGALQVESELGVGTTFTVRLPRRPQATSDQV